MKSACRQLHLAGRTGAAKPHAGVLLRAGGVSFTRQAREGKPALAGLAAPREELVCSLACGPTANSNSFASQKRTRGSIRAYRALVAPLGRKTGQRRHPAFMRSAARPHASLQSRPQGSGLPEGPLALPIGCHPGLDPGSTHSTERAAPAPTRRRVRVGQSVPAKSRRSRGASAPRRGTFAGTG